MSSLGDTVEVFLDEYKPTTRRSYQYVLENFADHLGADFPLGEIEPLDLIRYMQIVKRRPSITSPHTINKYVKTLKVFFNWCVRVSLLSESPAATSIKRVPADKKVRKEKAMKDDELHKLVALAQHEPRLLALVLFAADTGARRAGMAGLTWGDVHLAQQFAYVTEKGKTRQRVRFGDYTEMALRFWASRPDQRGETVFSADGSPISPAALSQYFRRRCLKAGIRSLGLHSLRHRLGHHLVENNPLSVAAKVLRHRSAAITAEYYSPEDDERVDRARQQLFMKPRYGGFEVVAGDSQRKRTAE